MQAIQLTKHVYWVGAVDDELRDFHGYHTARGSTYNAYLILDDIPILLDTVKAPFYHEMMARITSVIDPKKIKYIISNHAEMDHSGCLPQTIAAIKPQQVFASTAGVQALQEHFHADLAITPIKNEEQLFLGKSQFQFLETKMLHWPDSMFTFYANDGVLFSQDAFGMHLATRQLLAEQHEQQILYDEAAKYYANILLPYSALVNKLLEKFHAMNLPLTMIAPDHGPVWNTKNNIEWIVGLWGNWSTQEKEDKIVIVYDTMWHSTALMAKAIAEGAASAKVDVKVLPLASVHRSDVATEILTAKALLLGSPTINQQMFPSMADALCYLKGLKPKKLLGQAFGSYGWSGDAVVLLQKELQTMQINLVGNAITVKYVPTVADLAKCYDLGSQVAFAIQNLKSSISS